ncbi:hypothetical protein AB4124_19410 [Paenibacillus sp. 2KB_20]|uniref:hypothetical protein n=1 Tax=Paenibacillus sp. 2KB_20 TaxID=3232977 RepID=UPI003F9B64C5
MHFLRLRINRRLTFTMIVMMILILGCYKQRVGDSYDTEPVTVEEREIRETDYIQVPYEQLLYTKTASEFTWQSRSVEHLDPDIQQIYDDSINRAPGGWVLKETSQEIYMLISGGQLPSAKGFRIASMKMTREQIGDPKNHLYITLASQADDGTEDYPGQASVTSLIRIPKSGVPAGAAIQGVSMTGVD